MAIATISEETNDYARQLEERLKNEGFRVALDISDEKISYKVRELSLQKIPYILVVGKSEREKNTVSVRTIDCGEQKQELRVEELVKRVRQKVEAKDRDYVL
jgi:threonyl-tRNA synthetase